MTDTAQAGGTISVDEFEALKQMFEGALASFDQVNRGYQLLQEKIKKLDLELAARNAELADKNAELQNSLAKREALERQLQQASAMAALGEMSATVAHEIRNPLGAMGIWAGLLERDLEPQDPRRKTLGKITDGLAKLNKIVTNLLVYTRPIATDFRKVRLTALLEEIVDFTEIEIGRLGRDIVVEKNFDGSNGLEVMADPEKLNQVVINLCLNAVQAMEDGGTLSVGVACGNPADVENDSAGGGKYVIFTIADTGSGIDREHLDKIFAPFFTTKEDGTGLGLAIVKKIIEFHGGKIDIQSELGKGTQINCYLPSVQG